MASESAIDRNRMALKGHQYARLRAMLAEVLASNPFYARKLSGAGFQVESFRSLDDLTRLPFTTRQEVLDDQTAHPPYGTNLTYPRERYCRLHQTSGTTTGTPLRWLDTRESWEWFMQCWAQKYAIMGLRPDDRLFFPFSFGPFIGFWAAFEGAARLGNLCLPAGGMSSTARLRFLLDNQVTVVCCTPTYALRLAEVAKAEGIDLPGSPVRMLIVAGEPGGSMPATRQRIESAWGARVFDHWGMTEVGALGIECVENPGGFHLLETECIPEVIDGELVVTNLGRWGSPLIRYRTGDRVSVDPDPCPCGRVFLRLKGGILGRTDDMIIIRGNNMYPSAMEDIIRRFPAVEEFRIEVVESPTRVSLHVQLECAPAACGSANLTTDVAEAIRAALHVRAEVTVLPPGTLPRSEMKSHRVVRKMDGGERPA